NNPPDVMLKQKDQKDAELDKKIVALRKKNEALMKRYQEVEEDKKRAEQEGMSYTPRKDKAEDLTITIKKSPHETRVVKKKQGTGCPPSPRGVSELEDADVKDLLTLGRGKRMQLLVTMANKTKGKRIVSEKQGLNCPSSPGGLKDFNNEEEHRLSVGRGKQIQLTKTPNHRAKVKSFQSVVRSLSTKLCTSDKGPVKDLSVPTSRQEQEEYSRWKKEREQIDRERVARHKNTKGEWKRAWDVDKAENM
ncbi:CCD9B protein, partial [Polyodon spathula]|nr:CCD9B protein [Polyodon spathula]